ncbi:divalent metal cation transporter [Glaciecola sp. XM2]|uniref:NRAMP family divalent metal transporter n=1 Tax=Glaciecola sp. XM2 TaxID=1914931 RepID=UPI001BDF3587|nr:divalent metal cation transporter [Glaciecola sp. XM2]
MRSAVKGLIVTAAFIGPGTVTTASLVGAQLGYQLVWALLFALFATCVLQEMASRLGMASGQGLSQAILLQYSHPIYKWAVTVLICIAIGVGNAAYEGGNLTGAALGLSASFGGSIAIWASSLGTIAIALILSNKYNMIEGLLVTLVAIMSIVFISLMLVAGINGQLFWSGVTLEHGLFNNYTLLLAIVGTTIVPYNLFLHAGMSVKDHKANSHGKTETNAGLFASIGLGGLVTFAVMSSAATAFFATGIVMDRGNIASQLEPLLGNYASLFFALGLFAAGLTSAITAPLAASYALAGLFNWKSELSDWRFKAVSLLIIVAGILVSVSGAKPFLIIVVAQAANAILLPISAILLMMVCNNSGLMGQARNRYVSNTGGIVVVVTVLGLAGYKLFNLI